MMQKIHKESGVPRTLKPTDSPRYCSTDKTQMQLDYLDRQHMLRTWVDVETRSQLKLPPAKSSTVSIYSKHKNAVATGS